MDGQMFHRGQVEGTLSQDWSFRSLDDHSAKWSSALETISVMIRLGFKSIPAVLITNLWNNYIHDKWLNPELTKMGSAFNICNLMMYQNLVLYDVYINKMTLHFLPGQSRSFVCSTVFLWNWRHTNEQKERSGPAVCRVAY